MRGFPLLYAVNMIFYNCRIGRLSGLGRKKRNRHYKKQKSGYNFKIKNRQTNVRMWIRH